jgi:UDP:flavonoid glycosyltransferase YjiC (YdhE family)
LTTSISARAANIPLITVVSGVTIQPFYESGYVTFPDNFENPLTFYLPKTLKNRFMQWFLLNNKMLIRSFNKIAKKYNFCKYNNFNEIILGDHTFVCDDFTFLGIDSSKEFPRENFIGPIVGSKTFDKKNKDIDSDLAAHLKKPGKSIVVIMGSTGNRSLFLKIVDALNQTNYNVIAVYTNLLDENEIPKTSGNILFKKFVPFDEILRKVDLAIVHGGRGTIYQVAYSGKPAICFPMFMEHQGNVDNLIRQGSAVRLSKKFFKKELLIKSINNIFSNYESYQQHAQQLAESLQKESGEIKAAKRLFEIIKLYQ